MLWFRCVWRNTWSVSEILSNCGFHKRRVTSSLASLPSCKDSALLSWLSNCEPILNCWIISENLNSSATYCLAQSYKTKRLNTTIWQFLFHIHVQSRYSWKAAFKFLNFRDQPFSKHCFDISWLADESKWDHVVDDSASFILLLSPRPHSARSISAYH